MNHSVTMSCYKYVIQDYICEVNTLAYINILSVITMNAFNITHNSGGMQYHTIMYYTYLRNNFTCVKINFLSLYVMEII